MLLVRFLLMLLAGIPVIAGCERSAQTWESEVSNIVWVAYSPPGADPDKGIQSTPEAIHHDLAVLRSAGFTGLVTYSSTGIVGQQLPAIAASEGFSGLILGVWDPANRQELDAAKGAGQLPIVLGYCVGNEGYKKRYTPALLCSAMEDIRKATGKPVTTAEPIDRYSDPAALLNLGDWVFPNAHPYFHGRYDPAAAVRWTQGAQDELKQRTNRFVLFKEVGLPTAGDAQNALSEENQERYYSALARTDVRFVYFEGFDQPWKKNLPIEPHWGIFNADRTPKRFALRLMGNQQDPPPGSENAFYVYFDAGSPRNHFTPSGYMGDLGNIHIDQACKTNPHSGTTCIRVQCDSFAIKGSLGWAGVYWQEPPNNWGKNEFYQNMGFDLRLYSRLVFWARADQPCSITFKVGGIDEPYGDSLHYPRSTVANLDTTWKQFVIDLKGANLRHIIGGFCWVTNDDENPAGAVFFLDDIRYEP